jgi:glycosyltransferase involved in cell wall biosynthesis
MRGIDDARIVNRESLPVAREGADVRFVAPHRPNDWVQGIELVSLRHRKRRILRMLLTPSMLPTLLRQRADLYQFHDPELLPVGILLKTVFRKKVIYDSREDFPSMVLTKPWIPFCLRPMVEKTVSAIEHLADRCLDGIVTADSGTLARFAKNRRSKKLVCFNFPNLDFFPEPASVERPFDLIYRGGLSERTGTLVLLEALRLMLNRGTPARLLLLGYFDGKPFEKVVRESIRTMGLEGWIEVQGQRIKHEAMAHAISQARIGLSPLQPIPKFLHNIPVKIFEYWACGLPVVASDLPPIRPFFRHGRQGFLVKPGDPEELCDALCWLLNHSQQATMMGECGRNTVVERCNNKNEVFKLISFYQRVLGR